MSKKIKSLCRKSNCWKELKRIDAKTMDRKLEKQFGLRSDLIKFPYRFFDYMRERGLFYENNFVEC